MSQREVLIVSASTGTGHLQAAEAIREALERSGADVIAHHVDLLALAPRWVRVAYGNGYAMLATRAPSLWRELYRRTDAPTPDLARWGPIMRRILFREFQRLLHSRPWSVCACTHFLPGQLAAATPGAPPFVMTITDLTLHHFWAQPRVQRFFVANEPLAAELGRLVPAARIDVTGIPVSHRFATPPSRCEARATLGLDPRRPTVLVIGGGLGVGVESTADAATSAEVDRLQVIAVCGRNEGARERLQRRADTFVGRLLVRGFVPDVELYMAAADLVVTKPGGLTTSEVLAVGKPLVLTRAIPGQEEGNTRVLCEAGAALTASTPEAVRRQIEHAFSRPAILAGLSAAAVRLRKPRAATEIATHILRQSATAVAA